jgi:hypothetical protein
MGGYVSKSNRLLNMPVYTPLLDGNEKKYVNECLDSTWISSKGSFISRFEDGFSAYLNIERTVKSADIIVLLVDHASFKSMDLRLLPGKQVIDTRGIWS